MLWTFALVVGLLAGPRAGTDESPSGTLVLYPPSAPTMAETAEAIERLDRSARLVPVSEPWDPEIPPRQVVALGQAAARRARAQWPNTVRAEAFIWNPDRPDVSLSLIGRPSSACVISALEEKAPMQWLVVAASADRTAQALARALGAEVAVGRPREVQAKLRALEPGVGVWFRGHPDLKSIPWLESIPKLVGPDHFVGTDLPGLARFGFETPIAIDPDRTADRIVRWMHQPTRRKKKRSVEELPCSPA